MSERHAISTRLAGRSAIVTGASIGIGAAYARALAAEGASVALVDKQAADAVCDEIRVGGGDATSFLCDLTDPDAIERLGAALLGWRTAKLVLVNNAGFYPVTPLDGLTLQRWREVFALNLEAPLLLSLALIDAMKADGWGRIVNIGSSIVTLPRPGVAAYTASKAAVIGLTRSLASDLGPFGITANVISPGLTRTPGTVTQLHDAIRSEMFEHFAASQPIRRVIEPDDMTGILCFLASDASSMMTGQTLLVDGGLSRL